MSQLLNLQQAKIPANGRPVCFSDGFHTFLFSNVWIWDIYTQTVQADFESQMYMRSFVYFYFNLNHYLRLAVVSAHSTRS